MTDEELLHKAILAALFAGIETLKIYLDPKQDFGIERKADNSPLTLADKAAHKVITDMLAETQLPILSEEGAHEPFETRSKWERFWLIDPLDGTKEFIKKNDEFTVNIALIQNGDPVMGVVYVPAKDVLYYGSQETGAVKADHLIDAMAKMTEDNSFTFTTESLPLESAKHDDFVIVASRSHLSPETQQFIDEAKKNYDNVRTITSGSSIKICLVAEGTADAYPRYAPTMEWDTAAGDAIARCAGRMCYQAGAYDEELAGHVDSQDDEPLQYNKEELHNPWFLVR